MSKEVPRVEPMASHPQQPTKQWQAVKDAEAKTVQESVDRRAQRDRERHNKTEYASRQREQPTGE